MGCILLAVLVLAMPPQDPDPALKAAVERFFATQEAEDLSGYMALWSRTANTSQLQQQLTYIFESGDDRFVDLEIERATVLGETARVRVAVTRFRTAPNRTNPDGTPRAAATRLRLALAYVREDGEWKLVREGSPVDELANALLAAGDAETRGKILGAERDLVTVRLVDALGRRADEQARMTRYPQAQRIYEIALEAARAMNDRKAAGEMLQNIANSLYFQRNYPGALERYESRLALERESGNDEGIGSALVGIATIRYSTHEYAEALRLYREALEIQERLDDQLSIASTLLSTGNVLYLQGDYDGAIADYRRAEALKRTLHDLGGAAAALEGLGRTYAAQGDFASALIAFGGLLDESRKRKDGRRQASALQHMADVHTRLGNLSSALTAYEESRQLYEAQKELSNAARALQGIGRVELMAGRPPFAEAAYQKSQALCAAIEPEPDAGCVATALVGLAFAQASQERWDPAIASYRASIAAFTSLNAREAAARAQVGLAEALSGKGEYVAAMAEATAARHTGVMLDVDDLLWRALVSQSRAQRKLKRHDDALGAARAAVLAVRRMAAAALQRPGHAVPRDTTAAFAAAAILHAEGGDAAAAWTVVEEMRAHALRAALAPHERDIAAGMTDEELADERAADAELTPLLSQRDREKDLPKPNVARLEKLDAAIAAATDKRTTWHQQLFARLPDLRVWRGLAPPASIEDLDAVVRAEGELFVQFVIDEHDLLVLTAARAGEDLSLGAHVVPVRRQTIAQRVARAIDPAVIGDTGLWRTASAEILKLLPPPVMEQLGSARTAVVIPDDMLWRIPFEALPAGAGYLADTVTVRYAPSVTAMVRPPASTGEAPAFRVALVAAPAIPPDVVDTLKITAPTWTLRPDEPARAEMEKVMTAAGEEQVAALTGAAATEGAFRAAAAEASIVHASGPLRVNSASPLFSPMLLAADDSDASKNEPAKNGVLEAREIPTAGLKSRVLIVSDPAALSMRDAAAALPVVQWAWRAGGVETVVVRRWGSDETVTSDLLAAFYAALRNGSQVTDAMQAAAVAARKTETPAPPSAWAGWLVLSAR